MCARCSRNISDLGDSRRPNENQEQQTKLKTIRQAHEEEQEEARERDRTHRAFVWWIIGALVCAGATAAWAAKCNQLMHAQIGRESGLSVEVAALIGFLGGLGALRWVAPRAADRVDAHLIQWFSKSR